MKYFEKALVLPILREFFLNPTRCLLVNHYKSLEAINLMLQDEQIKKLYKCSSFNCCFTTDDSLNFINHLASHGNSNMFCIYCLENFTDAVKLNNHIAQYHSLRRYQCNFCLYRAFSIMYMRMHFLMIHKTNNIKFHDCHIERPFNFADLTLNLNLFKDYDCSFCTFQTPSTLNFISHLLEEHKGVLIYECKYCNDSFESQFAFVDHLKFHGMAEFSCGYCAFYSNDKIEIFQHLTAFHADEAPRFHSKSELDVHDIFKKYSSAFCDENIHTFMPDHKQLYNRSNENLDKEIQNENSEKSLERSDSNLKNKYICNNLDANTLPEQGKNQTNIFNEPFFFMDPKISDNLISVPFKQIASNQNNLQDKSLEHDESSQNSYNLLNKKSPKFISSLLSDQININANKLKGNNQTTIPTQSCSSLEQGLPKLDNLIINQPVSKQINFPDEIASQVTFPNIHNHSSLDKEAPKLNISERQEIIKQNNLLDRDNQMFYNSSNFPDKEVQNLHCKDFANKLQIVVHQSDSQSSQIDMLDNNSTPADKIVPKLHYSNANKEPFQKEPFEDDKSQAEIYNTSSISEEGGLSKLNCNLVSGQIVTSQPASQVSSQIFASNIPLDKKKSLKKIYSFHYPSSKGNILKLEETRKVPKLRIKLTNNPFRPKRKRQNFFHASFGKKKPISFKCLNCNNFESAHFEILVNHIASEYKFKPIVCLTCNRSFQSGQRFAAHYNEKHMFKDLKYKIEIMATRKLQAEYNMVKASAKYNAPLFPSLEKFFCPKCAEWIGSREKIVDHLYKEINYFPYSCNICKLKFARIDLNHKCKEHFSEEPTFSLNQNSSNIENYIYKIIFQQQIICFYHQLIYNRKISFCPFSKECDKNKISDLYNHVICHVSAEKFKCRYCPITSNSKEKLEAHCTEWHSNLPLHILNLQNLEKSGKIKRVQVKTSKKRPQESPSSKQLHQKSSTKKFKRICFLDDGDSSNSSDEEESKFLIQKNGKVKLKYQNHEKEFSYYQKPLEPFDGSKVLVILPDNQCVPLSKVPFNLNPSVVLVDLMNYFINPNFFHL